MISPHIPPHFFRPRPLRPGERLVRPASGSEPVEKVHEHLGGENSVSYEEAPTITVGDIMEADIIAVPPTLRLEELARLMTEKRISGFPVVGAGRELLGLVSQKDLLASMLEIPESTDGEFYTSLYTEFSKTFGMLPGGTVEDVMTPYVYFATPDTDIREVIELMLARNIHRVVVTERKRLVGMVTTSQLLRVLQAIL